MVLNYFLLANISQGLQTICLGCLFDFIVALNSKPETTCTETAVESLVRDTTPAQTHELHFAVKPYDNSQLIIFGCLNIPT